MKILKNIMLFAAVMAFTSCETDVDTPQISNPEKFVAPVLSQCSDVVINADNSKDETVVFSWTAADFGLPVQVLYSVYLSAGGTSSLLGTSASTSLAVSKGDLNGVVINGLGVAANETAAVSAYVTAKISGTDNYEELRSASSNSFNVSTYAAALKWLYLCGEFNSWTIDAAPIFWETSGGSNIYECMVDFAMEGAERSYFKVTAEQNWSGANWGYNYLTPSWSCPEQADSNLSLPLSEGNIVQISVNTSVMTIDKKAVGSELGLIGSFNDWSGDVFFAYSPTESAWLTEPVELAADAEIKIRVDGKWDTNWGASGAMSATVNGGYELSAGGGNIKVPAAGTYVAKLHANRTPYVLELVAQ